MWGFVGRRWQSSGLAHLRGGGAAAAMGVNPLLELIANASSKDVDIKLDEPVILHALQMANNTTATANINKPVLLNAVERVLQLKRQQRLAASVQQLQMENFGDDNSPELFNQCRQVLHNTLDGDAAAGHARSQYARCKRLLLFAPYRTEHATESSMKTYIAELAQQDLLSDYNNQPLACLKRLIEQFVFPDFKHFSGQLTPQVSVEQNFDDMLIPVDHVSRSKSDTFYLTGTELLRTHTSAHQTEYMRLGYDRFVLSGDVFRRDEIDRTHFPVFHQMEGVKLFPAGTPKEEVFEDLKLTLDRLATFLFPLAKEKKWLDCYFPFTNPSLELEIEYKGKMVELLGSGVIQPEILHSKCGLDTKVTGWAFGLGLDRLAMLLFDIPDVRLFWSKDERFLKQFHGCFDAYARTKQHVQFTPFAQRFEAKTREVSVWMDGAQFHVNDFFNIVRDVAGDAVEEVVECEDAYVDPKTGRKSKLFRIVFRSEFVNVEKKQVAQWMRDITAGVESQLGVKVR